VQVVGEPFLADLLPYPHSSAPIPGGAVGAASHPPIVNHNDRPRVAAFNRSAWLRNALADSNFGPICVFGSLGGPTGALLAAGISPR
jgi:hypothetical protein